MEREIPGRGKSRDLLSFLIHCWVHLAQMFVGIYLTHAD